MVRFLSKLFFVCTLCGISFTVHAQIAPPASSNVTIDPSGSLEVTLPQITQPLDLEILPANPKPGQNIYIEAKAFGADMDSATFSWDVSGKKISGKGMKAINTTLPVGGKGITVNLFVRFADGTSVSKRTTINPQHVELFWEGDGVVPPEYKGARTHSYGGTLKFTAFPRFRDSRGVLISSQNLIFSWKQNGRAVGTYGGLGKDSFVITDQSFTRDGNTVEVEVRTPDNSISGSAEVTVEPTSPFVILYQESPLAGTLYNQGFLSGLNINSTEATIRAEVYGISAQRSTDSTVSIAWALNGTPISTPKEKNLLTLRIDSEKQGRVNLSLSANHTNLLFQGVQKTFGVQFNVTR